MPDPARGLKTTRPDNEVVQGKKREVTSVFCARAGFLEPARTKMNNTIIERRILRRPNRGSPTSALRTPVVRKRSRPPPLAR